MCKEKTTTESWFLISLANGYEKESKKMYVNGELYFLKSNTIGPHTHTRANAAERRNGMLDEIVFKRWKRKKNEKEKCSNENIEAAH